MLGPLTLYAQYTVNTYNITYETVGGTNDSSNPATYTYGVGVTSFAPATKTGYTFNGWFTAPTGGTEITSISDTSTEDITIFAQYTANEYTVTYDLDGGTNDASNPAKYTFNQSSGNITLQQPTKTGYTFVGWYDNAAHNGNALTAIDVTIPNDQTIYARFSDNVYNITYELNGGILATPNPSVYDYGLGVPSFNSPTYDGYTFVGWYDAQENGNKVESITTTDIGDKQLYAIWSFPEIKAPGTESGSGIVDPNNPNVDIPFVPGENGINVIKPGYEVACGSNPFDADSLATNIGNNQPNIIVSASISNNILTINISPKPGFAFNTNQQTEFKYQLPEIKACPIIIDYVSLSANGTSNDIKTTMLKLELSQDVPALTIDNFNIFFKTRDTSNINITKVENLGNGNYNLYIDGNWADGSNVSLIISKDGYTFNPEVLSTVIYNVSIESLPQTGSKLLLIGTSLLTITGLGYFVYRRFKL